MFYFFKIDKLIIVIHKKQNIVLKNRSLTFSVSDFGVVHNEYGLVAVAFSRTP